MSTPGQSSCSIFSTPKAANGFSKSLFKWSMRINTDSPLSILAEKVRISTFLEFGDSLYLEI